jgi:excisionase family DNA binding protein
MDEDRMVVTVEEGAYLAGVSRSVLYEVIKAGKLKARKIGRRTIILRSDLQQWLKTLPLSHLDPPKPRRPFPPGGIKRK